MSRTILALPLCALLAGPVAADEGKVFRLVHVETGKVLAVADDSDEAGARAVLAKSDPDNKAQLWEVKKEKKVFALVNVKSGKVLDVNEDSKDEGATIIVWDAKDEDNDNQRWSWDGEKKESRVKSQSSGLVLDVDADGKLIQKKGDEAAKSQVWRLEKVK